MIRDLVNKWFQAWQEDRYFEIPVTQDFRHTSPYGTIEGKDKYLGIVESNKDKFLNNKIDIHDKVFAEGKACVRYTITNPDFSMEVTEWIYEQNGLIAEIISYYNIEGDIGEGRKVKGMD